MNMNTQVCCLEPYNILASGIANGDREKLHGEI